MLKDIKKEKSGFISELDLFLKAFDQTKEAHSASRKEEVNRYAMIYEKRDAF